MSAASITLGQLGDGPRDARRAERPGQRQRRLLRLRPEPRLEPGLHASAARAVGSAPLISEPVAVAGVLAEQAGQYCFRAEYTPDLFAPYSAGRAHEPDDGGPTRRASASRSVIPTATLTRDQARRQRQRRAAQSPATSRCRSRAASDPPRSRAPRRPARSVTLDRRHLQRHRDGPERLRRIATRPTAPARSRRARRRPARSRTTTRRRS